MPAVSRNQKIAMIIAEKHPEDLNPENKGLAKMSQAKLHEFTSTPSAGLPKRVHPEGRYRSYLKK